MMLLQINLLSILLSPVLFYIGSAALVMLLSHLNLIKIDK
jgi:hypothetical protein